MKLKDIKFFGKKEPKIEYEEKEVEVFVDIIKYDVLVNGIHIATYKGSSCDNTSYLRDYKSSLIRIKDEHDMTVAIIDGYNVTIISTPIETITMKKKLMVEKTQ
jgi:hypothetical protein